jgi:hypothetical protein
VKFDILLSLTEIPVQMPLFTSETAVQFGRLSGQARRQRAAEAKAAAALPPVQPQDEARKRRVLIQIDRCDDMLAKARNPEMFIRLTTAKERLWGLVFPKAGVMRPRSQSQRRPAPTVSETPASA